MGGGTLQLSSYGGQDVETIGNPQMTFFKSVYKRHTNFAIETIEQGLDGVITNKETKITSIVNKCGDLIHKCYLDIKLPEFEANSNNEEANYTNWTNATGYAYLKEASIYIGDLLIDKHISEWFDIWNELTDINESEHLLVNKHISKNTILRFNTDRQSCKPVQLYIPLQFWFNRFISSSLPLLALQYHDVKFSFLFRDLRYLINTDGDIGNIPTNVPSIKLYIDYIFLDAPERKQFAEKSHEYLIEQVQYKKEKLKKSNDISFNHPVKEVIWAVRNNNVGTESLENIDASNNRVKKKINSINTMDNGNDYFNYSTLTFNTERTEYVGGSSSNEPFQYATISFNGIDRFTKHRASYFRTIQPITYHSRVPSKHIYNYSFSIKPESLQPSGSCNFSRMQNAKLVLDNITTDDSELFVFARNYNVLAIHAGMGGLKYSN
jgi:hypothetical protein